MTVVAAFDAVVCRAPPVAIENSTLHLEMAVGTRRAAATQLTAAMGKVACASPIVHSVGRRHNLLLKVVVSLAGQRHRACAKQLVSQATDWCSAHIDRRDRRLFEAMRLQSTPVELCEARCASVGLANVIAAKLRGRSRVATAVRRAGRRD